MATSAEISLETFSCSICRDVYKEPVTIPCGNNHVGCRDCISQLLKGDNPRCPDCLGELRSRSLRSNKNILSQMRSTALACCGCASQVMVSDMSRHLASCDKVDKSITYFQPIKETTQRIPRDLPNRSTFKCPYCNLANLDTQGLLKHCNEKHRHETTHVVCPVCASMPWGDKDQTSSDFNHHLNMRHKFEYDTYVDYNVDEDAMITAAIQASLLNS